MRFGVTGVTGLVGRHVAEKLLVTGHDVVGLSRHPPSVAQGSRSNQQAIEWVTGSLEDPDIGERFVSRCDSIVHAGLQRSGPSFVDEVEDPASYFDVNVTGTLRLLEAAASQCTGRFVFVSSGAVHQRLVDRDRIDETHPLWPASLYGAYKASVETLVHAYGHSGKLACCSLRPTAIYGVADPIERSRWFDLIKQVALGREVNISKGSKCVHAADVAHAIILLLTTATDVSGQTYNCTDRLISEFEVAKIAKHFSSSNSVIGGSEKKSSRTMSTQKIQQLGMKFGGDALLKQTVKGLVDHVLAS